MGPLKSGEKSSEAWRVIAGFEAYEASSHGRVRRKTGGRGAVAGRMVKPKRHRDGYAVVDLCIDNCVTRLTVARAMALAFLGPAPSETHQAAHGDGDPRNDSIANIRWATPKENAEDADRHGRRRCGERHQNAKLTAASVEEMRQLRRAGVTYKAIASRFGVAVSNAYEACSGKRQWGHL